MMTDVLGCKRRWAFPGGGMESAFGAVISNKTGRFTLEACIALYCLTFKCLFMIVIRLFEQYSVTVDNR